MLDLGDTVEQVASKSGFSQSTIRRRVKLLSLDRDAFRRAELRGATLSDYAELDKIESVEDKNKALEALGTQNFRRVMQEVLENQKWEHRKAEWIAAVSYTHLTASAGRRAPRPAGRTGSRCRKSPRRCCGGFGG